MQRRRHLLNRKYAPGGVRGVTRLSWRLRLKALESLNPVRRKASFFNLTISIVLSGSIMTIVKLLVENPLSVLTVKKSITTIKTLKMNNIVSIIKGITLHFQSLVLDFYLKKEIQTVKVTKDYSYAVAREHVEIECNLLRCFMLLY